MALQLGDTAPDFSAETTAGPIRFHEWMGSGWAVLFSHPKDFTPVCTTELGEVARLKPEFDKRNVKVAGLSVDPIDSHRSWADDIRDTQGHALNFPLIADPDRRVSDLYGMVHPNAGALGFRGGTGQEGEADDHLSREHRAQLRGDPARDRLAPAHVPVQRRDPGELEARRGRDHREQPLRRRCEEEVSRWLESAKALPPHRPSARSTEGSGSPDFIEILSKLKLG